MYFINNFDILLASHQFLKNIITLEKNMMDFDPCMLTSKISYNSIENLYLVNISIDRRS